MEVKKKKKDGLTMIFIVSNKEIKVKLTSREHFMFEPKVPYAVRHSKLHYVFHSVFSRSKRLKSAAGDKPKT
jgi:hypothetical protein